MLRFRSMVIKTQGCYVIRISFFPCSIRGFTSELSSGGKVTDNLRFYYKCALVKFPVRYVRFHAHPSVAFIQLVNG